MSTYVIGDVQGCYDELMLLLDAIDFDLKNDHLWFVGDVVNRGPKSLETLRFVKSLGESAVLLLGNHDLHLLAVAEGIRSLKKSDTIDDVLNAPDRDELLHWLRQRPFLHFDDQYNVLLVHAGIYPSWLAKYSVNDLLNIANEVESVLGDDQYLPFLTDLFSSLPDVWSESLTGIDRLRFIVNVFTRIRYCDATGRLNFSEKGPIGSQPADLVPWFEMARRLLIDESQLLNRNNLSIVFGHWASIKGITDHQNIICVDTGCIWGGALTALRLEDQRRFSVTKERS